MTVDRTADDRRGTPAEESGEPPERARTRGGGGDPFGRGDGGDDPRLRRAIRRVGAWPTWVVVAVVAVPFALGLVGSVPRRLQYVPLVVSAVVFGMPHGAVDHLVPARLAGVDPWRSAGLVGAVYAVLGGLYLGWWFLAPVSAAVAFVAITWLHWGQGDVYLLSAATGGEYPRSRPHGAATLLLRGAMPMAVPLVAFPGEYRRVLADFVAPFGASVEALAVAFEPGTRTALAGALAALTVLQVGRGALRVPERELVADRGLVLDVVDTALLWVYFLSVPPVLAVGLYFPLWHAWRHVVRLVAVDDRAAGALRDGDTAGAVATFSTDAAPLTAVALAMCAGLYFLVPRPPGDVAGLVALYLVLIAVLTLPHVAVVTWMDARQGIW